MLARVYKISVNALLFYFVVDVIDGVSVSGDNLSLKVLVSLLFGFLMWAVIPILEFFKITINTWSMLLMGMVLSFGFLLVLYSGILGIGAIGPSRIDLGIINGSIIMLDTMGTLVFSAVITGASSVVMDQLQKY